MMERTVQYVDQDIAILIQKNPLAGEQLKGIILERLLGEAEAKLSTRNGNNSLEELEASISQE